MPPRHGRIVAVLLAAALLFGGRAAAGALVSATPGPPGSGLPSIGLSDNPALDVYEIVGSFTTSAPPQRVFDLLVDYSHLAGLFRGLESSRELTRTAESVRIEQVLEGRFLFFQRTLTLDLDIVEDPGKGMRFQEAAGPFRRYDGSWALDPDGAGCRVTYHLEVSRGDAAPRLVERRLFAQNALHLLQDLRRGVEARAPEVKAPAGVSTP